MYAVFAYVDIAWDARGTVLLGFAFAMCANFPIAQPERAPAEIGVPVMEHSASGGIIETGQGAGAPV